MNFAPCAKFHKPCKNPPVQTTFEDVFSEDKWLGFSFLGMKEDYLEWPTLDKLFGLPGDPLVISCEPLKDNDGRLVKIETPHETELELCVNIMEATPEDQHTIHEGLYASTSYECTVMYSATYRAASDPTTYYATSTYFPRDGKTNGLKRQISNFSAKENKKFYECWERYMEAINACPHHGFDTWLLNLEEAMDFLSYVAEVSRGWDESNAREVGRMKSQPNAFNAKHLVEECPTIPAMREMFGDQANIIGQPNNNASYGNTYNSNWRNHPNFSWKPRASQYTQPGQAPPQASNLEQAIVNLSKVVGDFVGDQKSINAQLSQRIDNNLQYSISRLTNLNTVQEKGKFPSQPHQNPKGIHEVEAQDGKSSQVREVKAVITLRSGKRVKQRKRRGRKSKEIENGTVQRRRTLNLLACVNLLPYSVYQQLGLGELKPTSITLSLADRSMKIPRCMVEDVLVQVDKFYYPLDFVVLDTDPVAKGTNCVPIILGKPFLVTSNAIINCRNGVMQLTFGNMTIELNIFYLCKKQFHTGEKEGPEEDLDEGLPEPSYLLATLLLWKRSEEILPLFNGEETQEAVKDEPPKLILKSLPTELKYAYLDENKQNPVVISLSLTIT
ncbi:hypothetical protein AAG906_016414 [Vitis piasezkii]